MKIYIAGPDVFRPDVLEWAETVRLTCTRLGHEALVPFTPDITTPEAIFEANISLLRNADAVIANLNPFRGAEPDSGTCVEVGFALALGKRVLGYIHSSTTVAQRVESFQNAALIRDHGQTLDRDGLSVEDFGLPLNLMLAVPVKLIVGGLEDCIAELSAI